MRGACEYDHRLMLARAKPAAGSTCDCTVKLPAVVWNSAVKDAGAGDAPHVWGNLSDASRVGIGCCSGLKRWCTGVVCSCSRGWEEET
jgi:hypothetical protein